MTGILDRPAPPPDLTVPYGPLADQVIDLRLPPELAAAQVPLIVLIHGGFWKPAYDRSHLGPMADPAALPAPPVPVTLVHGTDDDTMPLAMSQAFKAGRLIEIPGAGHFELIDPRSLAWPRVLSVLDGTFSEGRCQQVPGALP